MDPSESRVLADPCKLRRVEAQGRVYSARRRQYGLVQSDRRTKPPAKATHRPCGNGSPGIGIGARTRRARPRFSNWRRVHAATVASWRLVLESPDVLPALIFPRRGRAHAAVAGCKVETINDFRRTRVGEDHQPGSRCRKLDVKKDDTTVWSAVGFGAPTEYQKFDNQQTTFDIFVPGVTSPITSASGSLSANQLYSILVLRHGRQPADAAAIGLPIQSVNPTNSQLRFAEAAFGAGSIDLFLTRPGCRWPTSRRNTSWDSAARRRSR